LPDQVRADLLDRIRHLSSRLPDVLRLPARSVVDLCLRSEANVTERERAER
jgi:hypothetical protein